MTDEQQPTAQGWAANQSVIETARRMAEQDALSKAQVRRASDAESVKRWAEHLTAKMDWPVEVLGPIEYVRFNHNRRPEVATANLHVLVAGELHVVQVHSSDLRLLLPCSRCNRQAAATELPSWTSTPDNRNALQKQHYWMQEIGKVATKPILCAFCYAHEQSLACPTCHRPY